MLPVQKVIAVIEVVLDEYEISPKSDRIRIPFSKFSKQAQLGQGDTEKIMQKLQAEGWIAKVRAFIDEGTPFMPKIEPTIEFQILKPQELKKHRNALGNESEKEIDTVRREYQKFRFVDGTLFRDFEDVLLPFNPKDQHFAVMKAAFELPRGEWIDPLTLDHESSNSGRSCYDAGRSINKKIQDTFSFTGDFFELDKSGNRCRRVAE